MANKTVTVKPSGGTYTTLAAAIAGELIANADLTAMAGILNIEIGGDWSGGPDTTKAYIAGFTTSADYYINIYTDAANRAVKTGHNASRYILSVTDDNAIDCEENYVRIDGLQILSTYTSTASAGFFISGAIDAGNAIHISNCYFKNVGSNTSHAILLGDTDVVATVYNNIMFGGWSRGIAQSGSGNVYNNVIYGCTDDGFRGPNTVLKNNAIFSNPDDIRDDGGCTIDYNASDDGDGTNAVAPSGASWANEFVNAAAGDFTLLNTGNLYLGGTDVSLATDIDGDAYHATTPSIGVDEYVAAGGANAPTGALYGSLVGPLGGPI